MSDTTRRAVLAGAAGITAVTVLAACGDDSGDSGSSGSGSSGSSTTGTTGAGAATSGAPAAGAALAQTSQVPVGGGVILADKDVVITQPAAGEYKAFSATCTHQGCPVTEVSGGTINCKCHGSKFSATDGSVKNGPATQPLTVKNVKVEGTSITLA
jgi:Rieske Fe-S protein